MRSLGLLQRITFAALVPLWVLVLVLAFASIDRDIVESPVRVHGAPNATAYPTISSLLPFAVRDPDGHRDPRPGDRLIRVGDTGVQGASAPRVVSLIWASMSPSGSVALGVERDGVAVDVTGRMPAPVPKWPALIVSLVFGLLAIGGLLRFPDLRIARLAFPTLMSTALFMGARFGSTPTELLAAFWLQVGALFFVQPLAVRLVRHFPDGRAGASWARGWPWLFGLNGLILADTVLFDSLIPPIRDFGNQAITVLAPLVTLAVGIDRYRASNRVNRKRFKWLLLAVIVSSLPGMVVGFASALRPELGWWFLPSQLGQLAIPVGLFIAIGRYDLFDIDRVLNVAAVALGVVLVLGIGAVSTGPALHDALVARAGVSASTAAFLLVFGASMVCVPGALLVRSALDRLTLAQRRARESGVQRLLSDLSQADKLGEVGAVLTRGLKEIWNAQGAALFVQVEGEYDAVARDGELPADLHPTAFTALGAFHGVRPVSQHGILLDVQRPLVMRVFGAGGLEGALVLGPQRSGDPYEERDRSLVAVVAERVSAALAALEHREMLEHARSLNHALFEGKRRAEAASAEKTERLASATHDLRQPLQALRLFLGSLGEQAEGDERRGLVEKAQASAVAMQQQFEALLDESRLEAGSVRAKLQSVPLDEIFAEVHGFLEPIAKQKAITLEFDGAGLAVRSDPSLLRSVLQNLTGNAIRYTSTGGVRLTARAGEDEIAIDVTDTGRGMDEGELQHLFEAGRRGRSAAGESQGAGLGLSIVSRLCELLGHGLRVRSTPGEGSRISVLAEAAALEQGVAAPRASSVSAVTGARIVVIDDDDETREAVARLVRGWGAEVLAGASAARVLDANPGFAPDAALLDYALEAGTGLEALDALERVWGTLPAAILTGDGDPHVTARVRERGLPLLRKPAAPVQVRAILSSLVASRASG